MTYQLGIIGGVGSSASSYFYEKLLNRTKVNKDQDHLDMIILNHASIPDRTSYIIDHSKESPLDAILEDIKILNDLNVELIMIPCNTSHYFYNEFQDASKAKVYHMIKETVKHLSSQGITKVGIWATDGTIQSELYQKACNEFNVEYEIPCPENQKIVMSLIYDYVKAGKKGDYGLFKKIQREMNKKEVQSIILACTELSVLKQQLQLSSYFCDPLDIACDYILDYFHKEKI